MYIYGVRYSFTQPVERKICMLIFTQLSNISKAIYTTNVKLCTIIGMVTVNRFSFFGINEG